MGYGVPVNVIRGSLSDPVGSRFRTKSSFVFPFFHFSISSSTSG